MAAATYKILGQSAPTGTTETTLYTVPAGTQTITSSLTACNRTATAAIVDVNVRPNGAAVAASHSLMYQTPVPANSTLVLTLGLTMDATDVVSIKLGTANSIAVNLFGTEIA